MMQKRWSLKSDLGRLSYGRSEVKSIVLKSLLAQVAFPWSHKFYWHYLLQRKAKIKNFCFFRHSCLWTGSGRSVFRSFKFSRHWAKHFASNGVLVGMRKASF